MAWVAGRRRGRPCRRLRPCRSPRPSRRFTCTATSRARCGLQPSWSSPPSTACRCATILPAGKKRPGPTRRPTRSIRPIRIASRTSASSCCCSRRSAARLQTPDDYARLGREFVEDALAQNVMYGELFVSPSVWTFFNPGLDVRACFEALVHELRAAQPRATFKLLPDLTRNFGAEAAMETAKLAVSFADLDVIGVSLGGDETRFPPELFVDAFAFVRSQGMHDGRARRRGGGCPRAFARRSRYWAHERIGHGIHALRDRDVVDLLARRQIPLEICPDVERADGRGASRLSASVRRSRSRRLRRDDRCRRSDALRYVDRPRIRAGRAGRRREHAHPLRPQRHRRELRLRTNTNEAMHSRLGAELDALRRTSSEHVRA